VLLGEPHSFAPVACFRHDVPIRTLFEHLSKALPNDRMIIRKQNTKEGHVSSFWALAL
jgi:hypothetical protein